MGNINLDKEYKELRKVFPETISGGEIYDFLNLMRAICKSVIQKKRKALYSGN